MTAPRTAAEGAWERLARYHGGTVAELSASTSQDGRLTIFAATPAGVLRSQDAGRSWAACGPPGGLPFATSVALSPAFPEDQTIFAGTLAGLFRSRDGGDSWQPVLSGGVTVAVAVSPGYAEDRTVFVGTVRDGVLRSEDGGGRWTSANAGLLDLRVQALALSDCLQDDGVAFAGTDSGLYRSRNGGKSWQEADLGLDDEEVSVQAVRIGPRLDGARWVAAATEEHGLLLSDDEGRTWFAVPEFDGQSVVAVDLWATSDGLVGLDVATDRAFLRSVDSGVTWQPRRTLPAPAMTLILHDGPDGAGSPETLVGLVGAGIVRISADGLEAAPANFGLDATVLTHLALSPRFAEDGTLFAASADGTVLVSRDGGRTLMRMSPDLDEQPITGLVVSPAFPDDRTVWISASGAILRSQDAGQTWEVLPRPAGGEADTTSARADAPDVRVLAAICEQGRAVLFAAVGGDVSRSDDGGQRWEWLGAPGSSNSDEYDGRQVVALSVLHQSPGGFVLYAVTRAPGLSGRPVSQAVWRSGDGGRRWDCWLEAECDGPVSMLGWDSPPSEPNLMVAVDATVSVARVDARERRGGVVRPLWRSVDLGPGVSRITSLATPAGPQAGRLFYAGTNAGVYASRDGGRTFTAWDGAGAPEAVQTLAVVSGGEQPPTVLVLGHTATIWRRQDR